MTRARRRWTAAFALGFLLAGCKERSGGGHDHAAEHPEGHDHHAENHGHDEPMVRITRWTDRLEVFAEHPGAVAGEKLELVMYVTVLEGFRPLRKGAISVELEGPARVVAQAPAPLRAGVFRLELVPPKPGTYRGKLVVQGEVSDTIEGLELEVFADEKRAEAAVKPDAEEGRYIELLKEQQWGVAFQTAFVGRGTLLESIDIAGSVDTPPGGSAEVGAAIAGRVVAPPRGLPVPGSTVRKGQLLATLAPAPSSPEEAARASLLVAEAEARAESARAAAERSRRLLADEAIPKRELEDAEREVRVAEEAVRAARNAAQLFSGARGGAGTGSWRLVSPIAGTLTEVRATPGAAVAPGEVLFRVIDPRELWIRARVPEQDVPRFRADRDASFQIAGVSGYLPIDVTGEDANAKLVTVGREVDPVSRTVSVIYALENPSPLLRVGGLVRVSLPVGEPFEGLIVPRDAIVEDGGRELAYVQIDGEHFEERAVRTGPRQAGLVAVLHGLAEGERVVVRGAHVVHLSARAGSAEPHGHVH